MSLLEISLLITSISAEIAFEISHFRTFQTTTTLTLDWIIIMALAYHRVSLIDLYI